MISTLTTVGIGMVFGLALAAPPGPMNAIIAEETVHRGFGAGVRAGAGAMAADVCFFGLALVGVGAVLLERPGLQAFMIGVGGILMLRFGADALRDALRGSEYGFDGSSTGRGFSKAFVLGITNPYQLAFWLTVGVALLRPDRIDIGRYLPVATNVVLETGHPALFAGFFGGIVVWVLTFPVILREIGERSARFAPIVAGSSGMILLAFGVGFVIESVRSFLL